MKVITLNDVSFKLACSELASKIIDEDIVALIGVRTGGAVVANQIADCIRVFNRELKLYEVSASRRMTVSKKSNHIKKILKLFPRVVLNSMRVAEYCFVNVRMRFFSDSDRSVYFDDALRSYLRNLKSGVIYLIDDAIDSGATIKQITDEFKIINSELKIRVAVLVVTQINPLVLPDVSLYRKVLLRFPWSNDF
jgi:hypoxanthine phosphoribosyltransferase